MTAAFAAIPTRSGNAAHRATAIFRALYREQIDDIDRVRHLAADFRQGLAERGAFISRLTASEVEESADGTRKFRFDLPLGEGHGAVEAVWIPARWGNTLCVSTQMGCAMGCTFCHTGTMGLARQLSAAEIVGQVRAIAAEHPIDGVVYMGMGEPLHNFDAVVASLRILLHPHGLGLSHNRITVSTVGLVPEMERLARLLPVNLCVSLHAADDALRSRLVPSNRRYPLAEILAACHRFPDSVRRRLIFAYTVLAGVNDSPAEAARLRVLLEGLPGKINLIPFNPFPGCEFERPSDAQLGAFAQALHEAGFRTLHRTTRGADIGGACGQLATAARRVRQLGTQETPESGAVDS